MKTIDVVVLIACVAAAAGVMLYEMKIVKRKYSEYRFIPLHFYDAFKMYYAAGFISVGIEFCLYRSRPDLLWEYIYLSTLLFFFGKFGRRIENHERKIDESTERMQKYSEDLHKISKKNLH